MLGDSKVYYVREKFIDDVRLCIDICDKDARKEYARHIMYYFSSEDYTYTYDKDGVAIVRLKGGALKYVLRVILAQDMQKLF